MHALCLFIAVAIWSETLVICIGSWFEFAHNRFHSFIWLIFALTSAVTIMVSCIWLSNAAIQAAFSFGWVNTQKRLCGGLWLSRPTVFVSHCYIYGNITPSEQHVFSSLWPFACKCRHWVSTPDHRAYADIPKTDLIAAESVFLFLLRRVRQPVLSLLLWALLCARKSGAQITISPPREVKFGNNIQSTGVRCVCVFVCTYIIH